MLIEHMVQKLAHLAGSHVMTNGDKEGEKYSGVACLLR